jgi:small-conductance mechanosensitive channel
MEEFLREIQTSIGLYLPAILLAIVVLIVGWIVALALSALTRSLLKRTHLDDRLARSITSDPAARPEKIRVENWISTAVFWVVMLFTLVVFFQVLNVPAISGPLGNFLDQIVGFIPGILAAAVLLLIAWLIATVLRAIVVRVLNESGFTRRLSEDAQVGPQTSTSISLTIGNVIYWLVFLLFLPAILDALNLQGLLVPVQGMLNSILGFLPNILAAILILVIGWLIARIVRQIVTNLLAGLGIDRFGQRTGLTNTLGQFSLSNLIGTIVYILILIPVAIAALNALNIPAISGPASEMLTNLLNALPAIFGALLLLGIAYVVARLVGSFVAGILANIGFNNLFHWLGLYVDPRRPTPPPPSIRPEDAQPGTVGNFSTSGAGPDEMEAGRMTPSAIVGYLVTIAIMLFAVMEAANLLGFQTLTLLISNFIIAAGQILLGLLIFALGLYFSYLADRVIRESGVTQSHILAPAARVAIIIFASALALREMGIAESIVNLAFGLLLGAVAVATALAFGLGGRDVAAQQLEKWQRDLQSNTDIRKNL